MEQVETILGDIVDENVKKISKQIAQLELYDVDSVLCPLTHNAD